MKGLLLKDWYMAMKHGKMLFLFMFMCLLFSVVGSHNTFFMVYSMVFAGVLPVSLISYDEKSKWNLYSEIFPWSRAQVVSAKYLMAVILVGGMWLLSVLAQCIHVIRDPSSGWGGMFILLSILLVLGVFSSSIILPVIFKFGSEKGRIAYYAVIIVICGASAALSTIGTEMNFTIPLFWMQWLPLLLIIVAICIFAGSWMLSIKLYEKREL